VKDFGLEVKLDSNGLRPAVLRGLFDRRLVDYCAIDIKTSPEKYSELTGVDVDFNDLLDTVHLLRESGIDYEVRTTCIPDFVTIDDLKSIKNSVGHVKKYYLQQFQSNVQLMDKSWESITIYPVKILNEFREFVQTFSDICEIRGA